MPLILDKENLTVMVALDQMDPPPVSIMRIAEREGL